MNTQDTQDTPKESSNGKYLSKKVLVNGQYVTLYSLNGQTWLSSPEDIPELMARLENARIMLSNPEKAAEAEAQKSSKESPAPAAGKSPQNKYRMKGPKPRPILRQGGVVIKGTPVEPISASSTVITLGAEKDTISKAVSAKNKKNIKQSVVAPAKSKSPPQPAARAVAAKGSKTTKKIAAAPPVAKSAPKKKAAAEKATRASKPAARGGAKGKTAVKTTTRKAPPTKTQVKGKPSTSKKATATKTAKRTPAGKKARGSR